MGHRLDLGEPGRGGSHAAQRRGRGGTDDARSRAAGGCTATLAQPLTAAPAPSGLIRPLRRADIPAVVALRQRTFRRSESASQRALATYLESVLLAGDAPVGSLVYEDGSGHLAGFLGVVQRQMAVGREPVRVAVATQLMVAPGVAGLVGRRLARTLLDGPYDLVLSDAANDAARRVWESVGGRTAAAYSLSWQWALRPARAYALQRAGTRLQRAAAYLLRPACAVADAFLAASSVGGWTAPGDACVPFELGGELDAARPLLRRWALHPCYDARTVRWLLDEIALKHGRLPRQVAVYDTSRRLIGWAVYVAVRGGIAEVVQVVARPSCHRRVLAQLFADAQACGVAALRGRTHPAAMPDLAAAGATFTHQGSWMLFHATRDDVRRAIEDGRAFVSRLDGEWWMRF
jgi:hypothetical protein